jgi:hypothetical protein
LRVVWFTLAGLILLDLLVARKRDVWEAYAPDDYEERVKVCRQREQDLVVVGGSPVAEGFNTPLLRGSILGGATVEHVYNLGLPGGTTSEIWHAAKHGIVGRPKLVVYGITASDLNDNRQEPHGPYALMDWSDWRAWVTDRPANAEWVTRQFIEGRLAHAWQLYRYRNGIRLWAADEVESRWPDSFPEAAAEARIKRDYCEALRRDGGYAPNIGFVTHHYSDFKAMGGRKTSLHFLEGYQLGGHLTYLHKMLDHFGQLGVPVVLLDMPVTDDLELMYAPAFEQYRAALTQLERERGVRVLRPDRGAIGIGDRQFADLIHLNYDGAAKLTLWLRAELEREGLP